ncbi:MAG: hypothetical protein ACLFU7_00145 [Armatimonadota bacterium]
MSGGGAQAPRMRATVGSMIPVWFPEEMEAEKIFRFLSGTLADAELFVDPSRLVLVVDGCSGAEEPTRRAAAEFADRAGAEPQVIVKPENSGKGGAVCTGFERLLEDDAVEALNIRDADGDHDIRDLPQLFGLFETVRERAGTDDLFAVGSRWSLARPMGFARSELEHLLNRLTIDGVNAALVTAGGCVDERFTARYGRAPDFQSGYKIYSRSAARVVMDAISGAHAARPELEVPWWGVEFVPTVELLLRGFTPAALHRLTWDGQPQTTFDESDLARAYSRQVSWLFERLELPAGVAMPLLDNALVACEFVTAEQGPAVLEELRRNVIERVYPGWTRELPGPGEMFI